MSLGKSGRIAAKIGAAAAFAVLSLAGVAHADATHVVARGHTIESIANRYRVPAKVILEANKIKNPNKLKPGDTLTIPGVKGETPKPGTAAGPHAKDAKGKTVDPKEAKKPSKPPTYAMKPKAPGMLHLARLATSEEARFRAVDRRGKTQPVALKSVEKLLRSASGQAKPIDPRLVALLTIVSDHFGGRKIEVISGFRPYVSTQHTPHSNHNIGKAIDFRVVGVPNEVVRDFCKTLRNVGVGYYPNSTFVHMDVRTAPAFWIDFSRPGELPRYNDPNVLADEGTSDVGADVLMTPPSEGSEPAPGANTAPDANDGDKDEPKTETPEPAKTTPSAPSIIEKAAGAATAIPSSSAASPKPPLGATTN